MKKTNTYDSHEKNDQNKGEKKKGSQSFVKKQKTF